MNSVGTAGQAAQPHHSRLALDGVPAWFHLLWSPQLLAACAWHQSQCGCKSGSESTGVGCPVPSKVQGQKSELLHTRAKLF